MPYLVDPSTMEVIVRPPGSRPEDGLFMIDGDTAAACELTHGQLVTPEQLQALRSGSISGYKASSAASIPASSDVDRQIPLLDPPIPAQRLSGAVLPTVPESAAGESPGGSWVPVTSIVAVIAWIIAVWTSLAVKLSADHLLRDSFDASAVQIQQLNGSVTSHVLVALVLATAATIPLVVAVSARVCYLLGAARR